MINLNYIAKEYNKYTEKQEKITEEYRKEVEKRCKTLTMN